MSELSLIGRSSRPGNQGGNQGDPAGMPSDVTMTASLVWVCLCLTPHPLQGYIFTGDRHSSLVSVHPTLHTSDF